MTKKEQIIEMRNQGMTFQAIADKFGCSKQYVHAELNRQLKGRGVNSMKNKVVYKNILHWCVDNDKSISGFCELAAKQCGCSTSTIYNFLSGDKKQMGKIRGILAITGMTFEEAFGGVESED